MARAGNNAKKLAVLEVINNKKEILFSPVDNKKQKEEAWKEVLAIAQSVSLAGESRKWMHVKNLFNTWTKSTLEKVQKLNSDDEKKSPKIDEVDRIILGINNFINEQSSSPKSTSPRVTFLDTEISPSNQIVRKSRRTNVGEAVLHIKKNTTAALAAGMNHFETPKKPIITLHSCLKNSENKPSPNKAATTAPVSNYAVGPHQFSATKKRRTCSSPEHFKNKRVALRVSVTPDDMDVDEIDKPPTHYPTIQYQNQNAVKNSNNNFDLFEMDTYLRRLKIIKLERELNLPNMAYTVDTRSDEVELYYRRLQVSMLERELKFSPSKYSMGNIWS